MAEDPELNELGNAVYADTVEFLSDKENIRAENFKFYVDLEYEKLIDESGFVFKSQWSQGRIGLGTSGRNSGPLLIDYLYDQGSIEAR